MHRPLPFDGAAKHRVQTADDDAHRVEVHVKSVLTLGVLHLHHHLAPVLQDCAVHLCAQGGRKHRYYDVSDCFYTFGAF